MKIKLAGYIDAAGEQLLLNKKNQFQLVALRYAKLRGLDDISVLGSCPADCLHDEVEAVLDGTQLGLRISQYSCEQPWIDSSISTPLPPRLDIRAPQNFRNLFHTLASSPLFVHKAKSWRISKPSISQDEKAVLDTWLAEEKQGNVQSAPAIA